VITACRYHRASGPEPVAVADISEHIDTPDGVVWVDVVDVGAHDIEVLAEELSLHPLAVEDVLHHEQRPKLEHYPTHAFVVAYSANDAEVDLFVGPSWIVCVRERNDRGEVWEAKPALDLFERTRRGSPTVGTLLHCLLDTIVDGYFDAFDRAEDLLERLEDDIFSDDVRASERTVQHELFTMRRGLVRFRRHVVPLREVMSAILRREIPWIGDDELLFFQDVYDHVLRAVDIVDSARELMGNAVDAHLAIISNRMNKVMKKMTSWGAILFGAGLIAGVYGMNFTHMPELDWYWGYPMALGLMLALTLTLYFVFKRHDWL
jgi:magnesium transporter